MLACDVVAIGTPNYFGYMAGLVKDYFDRVWITIRDKVADRAYVIFGSNGGGWAQALESIDRICNHLRMIKAFESLVVTRVPTEEDMAQCRDLGKKLARLERTDKAWKVGEPRL